LHVESQKACIRRVALCILLVFLGVVAEGETNDVALTIGQVMTPEELKETGVSGLTSPQRQALDVWLNRYTKKLLQFTTRRAVEEAPNPMVQSNCSPAIETTISGDFEGWTGETIFKLDNGQIWEQAEYEYTYSYSYRPEVTIYQTRGGCRMKVEDEDETILVRRIK